MGEFPTESAPRFENLKQAFEALGLDHGDFMRYFVQQTVELEKFAKPGWQEFLTRHIEADWKAIQLWLKKEGGDKVIYMQFLGNALARPELRKEILQLPALLEDVRSIIRGGGVSYRGMCAIEIEVCTDMGLLEQTPYREVLAPLLELTQNDVKKMLKTRKESVVVRKLTDLCKQKLRRMLASNN